MTTIEIEAEIEKLNKQLDENEQTSQELNNVRNEINIRKFKAMAEVDRCSAEINEVYASDAEFNIGQNIIFNRLYVLDRMLKQEREANGDAEKN